MHLKSSGKCGKTGIVSEALTISEVAERSGVATSALRFYEDQGLIHPERNDSGHRRYPRAVIRLVAFIVFAQKVGLSLDEIRAELAKLPKHRVPERADWAKLSGEWTKRIRDAHRGARASRGRPQPVHRLRLLVARSMCAGESRRSSGAPRLRAAILDGRTTRGSHAIWVIRPSRSTDHLPLIGAPTRSMPWV